MGNKKVRREKLRSIINKEKEKGCSYCGYKQFNECLHFHHLDETTKDKSISRKIGRGENLSKILLETNKCIVLCANCHMALHNGDITI